MTDPLFRARLERTYAAHPLSANAVLKRIFVARGTLDGLSQSDLATAPNGGATDQNHVGGVAATLALAEAVGLNESWSVLDVGTGLGGTPRLLASTFGCRCHGVELTSGRLNDAVRLTALVRLEELVTFSHGDFLEVRLDQRGYNCVIMQGALIHFHDLGACLLRAATVLRPGGSLAVEDMLLANASVVGEVVALRRLAEVWNGVFPREEEWYLELQRAGLRVESLVDLTSSAATEFDHLAAEHRVGRLENVTDEERDGWLLGRRFLSSGTLRYVRTLATKPG